MKARNLVLLLLALAVCSPAHAQSPAEVAPADLGLEARIPVDPQITIGTFENGVEYYIKFNQKPENRAMFWLAVNAGSVQEDDDQLGLAHLVEHMGFNGTKHFAKQELGDYLESIGMRFGPDLNAFTSFDETVYFLNVPTDSVGFVEKGFQILEDWAHLMSFEEEEIDKERGVVIEEWRLRQGARKRMMDKQLPILFKDSRYAERLPIGKKEIIESCSYETLRKYYRDWYRPDLMAVVAVGDFDKDWILGLMKKHFASIPPVENPRKRVVYPVPDHDEPLFAIATDKEAAQTRVSVYFKSELQPKKTVSDYRRGLMAGLHSTMLNDRLYELTKKADPPFLYGDSGKGRFVRTKEVYHLGGGVKEDGIERGLDALLTEANRAKRFGFTPSEFERAKTKTLRRMEQAYKERDKTQSRRLAMRYVFNFLTQAPIPSPKQALALHKQLLPGMELEEVNQLANEWITDENRVILVNAPGKEEVVVPTEDKLLAVFSAAEQKDIQPYVDSVTDEPLIARPPTPADIVEEKTREELGITEWTLANGVHVMLKPTDFKNDEILFDSYSFGGRSQVPDEVFISAQFAARMIADSGVGEFDNVELKKKLTGKVVRVSPYIYEHSEGVRGSASPQDMETMFQLIHLYMTAPRKDKEAFDSYLTRTKGFIQNRSARPETAFRDTIQVTLAQYHERRLPWTEERLDRIDQEFLFDFYRDRFADASDFHFFLVGNFELDKIKPLVRTYLGSLPSINRTESWRDSGVDLPEGVVKREVYRGMEPKSMVSLVFTGPQEYGYGGQFELNTVRDVANIKLRKTLREELGGTYGVWITKRSYLIPKPRYEISLTFGCAPERVDEMIQALFQQIDSLKTVGPDELTVTKVREKQTREYKVNLKRNRYWIGKLRWMHYNDEDLMDILRRPDYIDTISAEMIRGAFRRFFDTGNYVQVVLYPEEIEGTTMRSD